MKQPSYIKQQGVGAKKGRFPLLGGFLFLSACSSLNVERQTNTTGITDTSVAPPSFTRGLIARQASEPLYPMRAQTQGVEGWVMLRFSVDEEGEVIASTIETIEEQPQGYFGPSAATAARRLSFENFRGITIEDVRYVFRYELSEPIFQSNSPARDEIEFRELIPQNYITPSYPQVAEELGIEGFVVVSFTVTPGGRTENITIEQSEPSGVFNDSAVNAASRLRFEPRIVFDEAVSVKDVQYRFDWILSD
jgi:TonB family protein